jgi:hypothetical protein
MTDNTPEVQTDDTSGAAQPNAEPQVQLVAADTQPLEPDAQTDGDASVEPAPKYFGKYNSLEEAEVGFAESQSAMHRANEEAAAYRKALDAVQPTPAAQPQPDMEHLNDTFRGQLETDPWNTLMAFTRNAIQQDRSQVQQEQSQMMGEYQKFANDPEFSADAAAVMQQLPFQQNPDVEKAFLRAKLQRMQTTTATQSTQDAALAQRMHVESGGTRPSDNTMRIELDADSARIRNVFPDLQDDAAWAELNRRTAVAKQMGLTGKKQVNIDQYRAMKKGGGNNG